MGAPRERNAGRRRQGRAPNLRSDTPTAASDHAFALHHTPDLLEGCSNIAFRESNLTESSDVRELVAAFLELRTGSNAGPRRPASPLISLFCVVLSQRRTNGRVAG